MRRGFKKPEESRRLEAKLQAQQDDVLRCPDCGSEEISLPSHSEPFNTCADCGRSWGGLYEELRRSGAIKDPLPDG